MSIKSVEFHIKSGDYFGTIATVLSLVRQIENKNINRVNINILKRIENDLIFLQREYKIIKK